MPALTRRTLLALMLLLAALLAAGDLLLLTVRGSRAPAWAHLWCSASKLHPASGHAGQGPGGPLTTLLDSLRAVVPHWPHILPLLVALATLIYLWRANARYQHELRASSYELRASS
jgi:hypothetical protein